MPTCIRLVRHVDTAHYCDVFRIEAVNGGVHVAIDSERAKDGVVELTIVEAQALVEALNDAIGDASR